MPNLTNEMICYCEDHGIYEVYSVKGNVMTWYSYFGREGFYKVIYNIRTKEQKRIHLNYKKTPKFLLTKDGATKYNYFCG